MEGRRRRRGWDLALLGELPEGFARTALDCGLARSLLRCEGREQALALLRRDGDAIFALPTAWGGEKILDLARSLGPTWRRGLLVGARDNLLGIKALNSDAFAYYLTLPLHRESLEAAAECLEYWYCRPSFV